MRINFFYSKTKEKEKLLNIFSEYQWFIDNDFPIVLPKFYRKLYQEIDGNKKLFKKELTRELGKIYNKNIYKNKREAIKNNWQKIEKDFFKILNSFKFKIQSEYICNISLYGPEGQFEYPNIINLRASRNKDIKEANITIAHELLHLIIFNKAKKLKLNYKQIEGIVDLFFLETKLRNIFPSYQLQNMAKHNKNNFIKFISSKMLKIGQELPK